MFEEKHFIPSQFWVVVPHVPSSIPRIQTVSIVLCWTMLQFGHNIVVWSYHASTTECQVLVLHWLVCDVAPRPNDHKSAPAWGGLKARVLSSMAVDLFSCKLVYVCAVSWESNICQTSKVLYIVPILCSAYWNDAAVCKVLSVMICL